MPLLAAGALTESEISLMMLSLTVLLAAARVMGELSRRLGQPAVLGEILAGILLGRTVLGQVSAPPLYDWLFPTTGNVPVALQGFTVLAVTLLLLVAGIEVDLPAVWRQGRAALMASLTGIVVPFAIGFGVAYAFPRLLGVEADARHLTFALFVGVALSITALPVIAKTLMDLNLFRTDLGMLIMSAAMLDDLVGWMGFALIMALMAGGAGGHGGEAAMPEGGVAWTLGLTVAFLAVMLTLGRWLIHRALPVVHARWSWPGGVIGFVLIIALACAAFTASINIHSIFGAFIAGVVIGDSRHLRGRTREVINNFVSYVFAPVFFASIGLRLNFVEAFNLRIVLVVLVIAIVSKVVGCWAGARLAGMGSRESWAVGFGMAARGAMEIILGQLAFEAGLIGEQMLVALIIMALVTSVIAGPAMQALLRRKQPRRLLDLLSERNFLPALAAADAHAAVREMAQRAAPLTGLDAGLIADAVWQREQLMHTGVGQGLAVPHARLPQIKKPVLLLGRSERGVDFDAPDGTAAHFVCMLLSPTDDQTAQLEILGAITKAFMDPRTRASILAAASYTELVAALQLSDSDSATPDGAVAAP